MKYYQSSFAQVLIRFYIMIAVALIAGFANIPWLALLCLPIFFAAILGIKFELGSEDKKTKTSKLISTKHSMTTINEAA